MKKLLSLVICLFMLCALGVMAFADPEEEERPADEKQVQAAHECIREAMAYEREEDKDYSSIANCYAQVIVLLESYPSYYAVTAYACKLAALAYENDDNPSMAEVMIEHQQMLEEYAEARRNSGKELVDPSVFFGSGVSTAGSILSKGSLTIIVGVACLAVGFLVAMFIFKKKKPALADGAETDEE